MRAPDEEITSQKSPFSTAEGGDYNHLPCNNFIIIIIIKKAKRKRIFFRHDFYLVEKEKVGWSDWQLDAGGARLHTATANLHNSPFLSS